MCPWASCPWLLSDRDAGGLVVRPCLWPVVRVLWRLRHPWGAPDLEAVPRGAGDTLPEWKSSVPRLPSDTVRPAAVCNEQESLIGTRAPGGVPGYYCCFSVGLPHHLQMDCFNLEKRDTHPCSHASTLTITQFTRHRCLRDSETQTTAQRAPVKPVGIRRDGIRC